MRGVVVHTVPVLLTRSFPDTHMAGHKQMKSVSHILKEKFGSDGHTERVIHVAPVDIFYDQHGVDMSGGAFHEWLISFRWRTEKRVDWTLRRKDGTGPYLRSRKGVIAYFKLTPKERREADAAAAKKRPPGGAAAAKKRSHEEVAASKKQRSHEEAAKKKQKQHKHVPVEKKNIRCIFVENQGFKISNKTTLDRLKKHFLKLPLYAADGYNGVDLYVGSKLIESLDEVADGQKLQARVFIEIDI